MHLNNYTMNERIIIEIITKTNKIRILERADIYNVIYLMQMKGVDNDWGTWEKTYYIKKHSRTAVKTKDKLVRRAIKISKYLDKIEICKL